MNRYEALVDIDGFKKGDEVPSEKAMVWMEMYKHPPVQLVESGDPDKNGGEVDPGDEEDGGSQANMLDDYLARSKSVVLHAINSDNLAKEVLEQLLQLEKSGKNRSSVVKRLEELSAE